MGRTSAPLTPKENRMIPERKALPALLAGAALALAASGCASWHDSTRTARGTTYGNGNAMNETNATGPSTTDSAQGNRNALMATIDDQTTQDIEQALHAASGVDARGVVVRTMRGHVELSGTVRDDAQRQRVIEIARNTDVEKVVDVQDKLRVEG